MNAVSLIPAALLWPAAILLAMTSTAMLVSRDWRACVGALAAQYVGVFVMVAFNWPLELALVKMIAGWMTGAVLGVAVITAPQSWREQERSWPSGRVFRLLASLLAGLVVISLTAPGVALMPGLRLAQMAGALTLMSMGLLQLGLTAQPLRVTLGLLTVLAGFEILYASVEAATLVAGLLATVNLALALAGAYLLIAPTMGDVG